MPDPDKRLEFLRALLAENDTPCPQCGYNLRMLEGDICPECGEQIVLAIRMAEPRLAAPLTGLIGLSAGVGLNGLLLMYALIQYLGRNWGPESGRFIKINGVGSVCLGSFLAAWLLRWRWIRARPATLRWTLAAGCWIVSLIDVIIFSIKIR